MILALFVQGGFIRWHVQSAQGQESVIQSVRILYGAVHSLIDARRDARSPSRTT